VKVRPACTAAHEHKTTFIDLIPSSVFCRAPTTTEEPVARGVAVGCVQRATSTAYFGDAGVLKNRVVRSLGACARVGSSSDCCMRGTEKGTVGEGPVQACAVVNMVAACIRTVDHMIGQSKMPHTKKKEISRYCKVRECCMLWRVWRQFSISRL
jgi:hypothetical protein